MPKIPVVVKVWAGTEPHDFEYISRSLPSLLASELPDGAEILIFDDCSNNERLQPFLNTLAAQDSRVRIIRNEINKGPNWGQVDAFTQVEAEYPDAPYFVNVDDDMLYHRKWFRRLQKAREELSKFGLNGIFTAVNIPLRPAFAELRMASGRYLLKWKQPAFNWVIPREIYELLGGFRDEGIAYDTEYLHRLRLYGLGVICLSPSYVQNIGLIGAYARDRFTTANDFLGGGEGSSRLRRLKEQVDYALFRVKWALREPHLRGIQVVAPIRWGVEMVYEGMADNNTMVALYWLSDQVKRGWNPEDLVKRTHEVLRVQPLSPLSIRKLHKTLRGKSVAVECNWNPSPNLREYLELKEKYLPLEPKKLLIDILSDLAHFHQQGVIHNKIRQDNIYYDPIEDTWRLAWFGSEFSQNLLPSSRTKENLVKVTDVLNKNTRSYIRERFLCHYLEAIAPEVLQGEPPSLSSDVFSAVAVVLLTLGENIETLQDLEERREAWVKGNFPETKDGMERNLYQVISACLAWDLNKRFKNATEALNALKP